MHPTSEQQVRCWTGEWAACQRRGGRVSVVRLRRCVCACASPCPCPPCVHLCVCVFPCVAEIVTRLLLLLLLLR
jgi:hypothetical protein